MPITTGRARKPSYRCFINAIEVFLANDITQNEALEDLTTMVVDVELANFPIGIQTGQSFVILQTGNSTGNEVAQFTGILDSIDATSHPNSVKLTAVGPLSKLRRAPLADHDLSGMTDGAAIRYILTTCGLTHAIGDIYDFGYTLGAKSPIKWKKGTQGADMVREIDRVFQTATMEIGSGRIVRFPYTKALNDIALVTMTYDSGNSQWYYGGERKRGGLDAIQNYWTVSGLSYTSDSAGNVITDTSATNTCQAQIFAEAKDTNPKIVGYNAPQSFSSDLIQSEGLAKLIAQRLMHWYNRESDTVLIETVNDPRVTPGDYIGLDDSAYGMDLLGGSNAHIYLVLNVDRDRDFMRLSCIGGPPGEVSTLTSGNSICCGTQQADGTCSDQGTNGPGDTAPTPEIPPDPVIDTFDPTLPPDPVESIPPDPAASQNPVMCDDLDPANITGPGAINIPWRTAGGYWTYFKADGTVATGGDEIVYYGNYSPGSLYHNVASAGTKTAANDDCYGPIAWTFCAGFAFCDTHATQLRIAMVNSGGSASSGVTFYPAPGIEISGYDSVTYRFDGQVKLERGQEVVDVNYHPAPPGAGQGSKDNGLIQANTEVYFPKGGGSGIDRTPAVNPTAMTYTNICFSVDLTQEYQAGKLWGDIEFEGYTLMCVTQGCSFPGEPIHYTPCAHYCHNLIITAGSSAATDQTYCPNVMLKDIGIGSVNCVPNPDYNPTPNTGHDGSADQPVA